MSLLQRVLFFALLIEFVRNLTIADHEQQRFDGWYNNRNRYEFGSTLSGNLIHLAPLDYADDVSQIIRDRPDAGLISYQIFSNRDMPTELGRTNALHTAFASVVIDELISLDEISCPVEMREIWIGNFTGCQMEDGTRYCNNTRRAPFYRNAGDRESTEFGGKARYPRNSMTPWIDASYVYGSSTPWVDALRRFKGGELRESSLDFPFVNDADIPLANPAVPAHFPTLDSPRRLYAVGSESSNRLPTTLAISIVFHRYHNVLARNLAKQNPMWDDFAIFERTRQLVTAIWQNIIFYEYLPLLLSIDAMPIYDGYDQNVDPSISTEFAAAAMRFHYSTIGDTIGIHHANCSFTSMPLCQIWWDASIFMNEHGFGSILRGMLLQRSRKASHTVSDTIRDRSPGTLEMNFIDQIAETIERARDYGIADYNRVRTHIGLSKITNWTDINRDLFSHNPKLLTVVREIYSNNIDNVDLYVGGMLETTNGSIGPTFSRIIRDQFIRIRRSDRFWFENIANELFTSEQIELIRRTRMSSVLRAVLRADETRCCLPTMPKRDAFVYDGEMFCFIESYKNVSKGLCPPARSYDFWTGSNVAYNVAIAFGCLCPFVCYAVMRLVVWFKRTPSNQGGKSGLLQSAADLLLSKANDESKYRLLFDLYNSDQNGLLTRADLFNMIKALIEIGNKNVDDDQVADVIGLILERAQLQDKQHLSFDDFYAMLSTNGDELLIGGQQPLAHRYRSISALSLINEMKENEETTSMYCSNANQHREAGEITSSYLHHRGEQSEFGRKWNRRLVWLENHRSHAIIIVVFVFYCIYLFADKFIEYVFFKEHIGIYRVVGIWAGVSRGSAQAIAFTMCILLLTVCSNALTAVRQTLFGYYIPSDSAIDMHTICAIATVFFSILHVIGHAINFYRIASQPPAVIACLFPELQLPSDYLPKFHYWIFYTVPGFTGMILIVLMSIMVVFAVPYARRHIHRCFQATHRWFTPIICLTIMAHGSAKLLQPPFFWKWILVPVVFLTVDRLISLRRKRRPISLLKYAALPSEVTYLSFRYPSGGFYSGQWARISCDAISESEFHPFTITSAPYERCIDFHIRGIGPWTKSLNAFIRRLDDELNSSDNGTCIIPKFYLEGPYGSTHQDWYKYKTIVLVSGGIGVTPTSSLLKDLVHKVYTQSEFTQVRVYFVWLARNHQQFEWFLDILREVEKLDSRRLITIDIFVTQLLKECDIRTKLLYICEHQFRRLTNCSVFTGLRARTHFGRIDFDRYLSRIRFLSRRRARKIGVFSCGPLAMVRAVAKSCHKLNLSASCPQFISHQETF